ncbi:MAG TPA: pyridoxamine 5'-phosphate oxidase family protein, partial [Nitrososphaerales archaeon]|nr:pyridoxamine 5'-phosphate oxidase family protein [Nitrososphaerales archaeon]
MFETEAELEALQALMDESFRRSGEQLRSVYGPEEHLDAAQLSGFKGVRLVAVATLNSKGEPRVAPRSAAFLHGSFYLAVNSKSVTARRLLANHTMSFTYYENKLLILGHGTAFPLPRGSQAFESVRPEWEKA